MRKCYCCTKKFKKKVKAREEKTQMIAKAKDIDVNKLEREFVESKDKSKYIAGLSRDERKLLEMKVQESRTKLKTKILESENTSWFFKSSGDKQIKKN